MTATVCQEQTTEGRYSPSTTIQSIRLCLYPYIKEQPNPQENVTTAHTPHIKNETTTTADLPILETPKTSLPDASSKIVDSFLEKNQQKETEELVETAMKNATAQSFVAANVILNTTMNTTTSAKTNMKKTTMIQKPKMMTRSMLSPSKPFFSSCLALIL
jgi:hypothetical protein